MLGSFFVLLLSLRVKCDMTGKVDCFGKSPRNDG